MPSNAKSPLSNILIIDSSDRYTLQLAVIHNGNVRKKSWQTRAQYLPEKVEELLGNINVSATALDYLIVLQEGNSLTGARMGLACAEALSFLSGATIILSENSFAELVSIKNTDWPKKLTALNKKARAISPQ